MKGGKCENELEQLIKPPKHIKVNNRIEKRLYSEKRRQISGNSSDVIS